VKLEVSPARFDERPLLANLLQFYIHDFSQYWAGEARGELGDDGRFEDYPLDGYWTEPGRVPLLFRLGGALAGFALLNTWPHLGAPVDHNMSEFFVARKHRGAGVGRAAAHAIFDRYPGRWETAVARRNPRALPFWRRTIASHPGAEDIVETDLASDVWDGQVFRFRIGGR
jgi:predicted acetyltransferase